MGQILLCADTESLIRPWMMGLDVIDLESIHWLVSFSKSEEVRSYVRTANDIDEVWIVSADDIASVNLAAAIHKDRPSIPTLMVMTEATGSAMSCAKAAGVTKVIAAHDFGRRFGMEVNRRKRMEEAAELVPPPSAVCPMACSEPAPTAEIVQGSPRENSSRPNAEGDVSKARRPRNGNTFLMSVMSGSGGSGKSALSATAAGIAAFKGFNTLLVDCDLQFGDLKYLFGMMNAPTIDDALSDRTYLARLSDESRKQGVPALLVAPTRIESSESLEAHISAFVDEACDHFDAVIVNTGAKWDDLHAELLEKSNYSVFLIDQRATSVHACKHAVDLCLRMGIATGTFLYALNRCDRGAMFGATDIASIMHDAHVIELKEGGQEVEELLGAGLALELAASKNDFVRSVNELMSDLLHPFEGKRRSGPVRMARRRDDVFAIGNREEFEGPLGQPFGFDTEASGALGGRSPFSFGRRPFGLRGRSRRRRAGKHGIDPMVQGAGSGALAGTRR